MKLLTLFLAAASLQAGTIITTPTPGYTSATSLVSITDSDEALINVISDGAFTITFPTLMRASTVGVNWDTWGAPPFTESADPRILWSGVDDDFNPITSVTMSFSSPVAIFGFEAEPGPLEPHTMVATFFSGGVAQDTVTLDVDGNGGARLFAVQASPGVFFDSVTLESDADWAAGQFRYATAAVPEPASWMLAGLAVLAALSRKMRGNR